MRQIELTRHWKRVLLVNIPLVVIVATLLLVVLHLSAWIIAVVVFAIVLNGVNYVFRKATTGFVDR